MKLKNSKQIQYESQMLKQLWPMIAEYVQNLINTVIEDSIQGYMPSNLGVFKFTNVDIGDVVSYSIGLHFMSGILKFVFIIYYGMTFIRTVIKIF